MRTRATNYKWVKFFVGAINIFVDEALIRDVIVASGALIGVKRVSSL